MATEEENTHIAATLLARAHPPEIVQTIFREKVRQRPLLLRPTSPDPSLNARSKRQYERHQKAKAKRKSKKPRPLSAKQKRILGVYNIPKEQAKYAIYEPLHQMWCGYMREVLGIGKDRAYVEGTAAGPLVASADLHGASVEVVRSRCVSRVGLGGIVVKDNRFTLEIVTPKDEVKLVPKEHTVFAIEVPFDDERKEKQPLRFELYGSQLETRAPERATKKFRPHFDPGL